MFSGVRRSSGVQGLRVIVQSEKSPDFVETRIEAFLDKVHVSHPALHLLRKHCIVILISKPFDRYV